MNSTAHCRCARNGVGSRVRITPSDGLRPTCRTISPLARPGKAIALEAQIELWSAISRRLAFLFLKTTPRSHEASKTSEAGSTDRLNGAGAGCHEKSFVQVAGRRRSIFLTAPFIEHL